MTMLTSSPVPTLPEMAPASTPSVVAFVIIVLGVAAMIVWGTARASRRLGEAPALLRRRTIRWSVGLTLWLAITALLSGSGVLEVPGVPPRAMLMMGGCNLLALALALSPAGARLARGLPVAALVGFHSFRLPLELVLHRWYVEGVLPVQMTYQGRNLDIITGLAGLALGVLLWRRPNEPWGRALVWAFNLVGLGLLINVISIAVLSSPFPFRVFMNEPAVQLIYYVPYGWIVPMCVAPALAGHVVLFRWLARAARDRS